MGENITFNNHEKGLFCTILVSVTLHLYGQLSLGADLLGIGLTNAHQNEIGMKLDSSLSTFRVVFSVNNYLEGAYKFKHREFSLGLGWNSRSHADGLI